MSSAQHPISNRQNRRSSPLIGGTLVALLVGCTTPGVVRHGGGFQPGTLVGGDAERQAILLVHRDGTETWLPISAVAEVRHSGPDLWRMGMVATVLGASLTLLMGLVDPFEGMVDQYRIGALFGGAMLAASGGMLIGFGADQEAVSKDHLRRALRPRPKSSAGGAEETSKTP
jgi:hypothetical protein